VSADVKRREWALEQIEGRTVPVPDRWPARMRELVRALQAAGWVVAVDHHEDSGGSPFLSVRAVERDGGERKLQGCWHTRGTGTYRLFSMLLFRPYQGWHHLTVRAVLAAVGVR
jgi:hypothetical protein